MEPEQAPVRPRVRRDDGVEALLLEEEVADLLDVGARGWIGLIGPSGCGRTTALRHLAAQFPRDPRLALVDGPPDPADPRPRASLAIYSAEQRDPEHEGLVLRLVPWELDDCIEYLLARAPERCASVVRRIARPGTAAPLLERPATCVPLLDVLAADESIENVADAVHRIIDRQDRPAPRLALADLIADGCLREACGARGDSLWAFLAARAALTERIPIVGDPTAHTLLAARVLARVLARGRLPNRDHPPHIDVLLAAVIDRLRGKSGVFAAIQTRLDVAPTIWHAFLASLLLALDPTWRPDGRNLRHLVRARLEGASWKGVSLEGAILNGATFRDADLTVAHLDDASADAASFENAALVEASLRRVRAYDASFVGADLSGADLTRAHANRADFTDADLARASLVSAWFVDAKFTRANLAGADLSRGMLRRANFEDADLRACLALTADFQAVDLRRAALEGADFTGATLTQAHLDEVVWPGALLRSTTLDGAGLTGARMPGAQLEEASLVGARLADIDLSGANLQRVDFRGATFRMGTSRSGLISSPIASEGTRTGFYSDDTLEMSVLDPDSVRTADLRGADLRGASFAGADFFLVDLRGARLDPPAIPILRAMRAILDRPDPA